MTVNEKYECQEILGEGAYAQVRIGVNSDTNKKIALKLFKNVKEDQDNILNEAEILSSLDHKNVIRMIEYEERVPYVKTGKKKIVSYIATELAESYSLFDYINASGGFTEQLSRNVFGQILEAVEYIHSKGIFHRDIKSENVFLDKSYQLKLGDFGFATTSFTDNTYCGSGYYMAPEIIEKVKYNCAATDIFSLGVLLFFMVTGKYPFYRATNTDDKFKLLRVGKTKLFWRISVGSRQNLKALSQEFIDLVTMCLSVNPLHRPSVAEIKSHAWFKGLNDDNSPSNTTEVLSQKEVAAELSKLDHDITPYASQSLSYH